MGEISLFCVERLTKTFFMDERLSHNVLKFSLGLRLWVNGNAMFHETISEKK